MISLNLKTLQLQCLIGITTVDRRVTTGGWIYAVLMKPTSWISILVLSLTEGHFSKKEEKRTQRKAHASYARKLSLIRDF